MCWMYFYLMWYCRWCPSWWGILCSAPRQAPAPSCYAGRWPADQTWCSPPGSQLAPAPPGSCVSSDPWIPRWERNKTWKVNRGFPQAATLCRKVASWPNVMFSSRISASSCSFSDPWISRWEWNTTFILWMIEGSHKQPCLPIFRYQTTLSVKRNLSLLQGDAH